MSRQHVLQVCLGADDYAAFIKLSRKRVTNPSALARSILIAAISRSEIKPLKDHHPKASEEADQENVPTDIDE